MTTTPTTLSPVFKVLIDFSSISAKDSSISNLSSLILFFTSFIIHPGVDAPAVIPTEATSAKPCMLSSSALSTQITRSQHIRHNSARCLVLELCGSPITIITSHCLERAFASLCLLYVALHIVSKISTFVHSFFDFFRAESQISFVEVVWETKVRGKSFRSGAFCSHCSNSAPDSTTSACRHHPAVATTSGWVRLPTITGSRPCSSACCTRSWMRLTLGQVASKISAPRAFNCSYTAWLSPWERMMTRLPSGTSSGLLTQPIPCSARASTTWALWMIGPSITQDLPSRAACCASSTARLTP